MEKAKRILIVPALCLLGILLSATGAWSAADVEEPVPIAKAPQLASIGREPVYQYLPESSKALGTELALSNMSKEIAGKVYYQLKEEGEQALAGKVAVVCAVPLSDLKRETEFGRMMAEYLLTDLADRGLQVTELRLGREIIILPQSGEFIMTRNAGELANEEPALDYVVLSTFSNTRKALIVQGRLVTLQGGTVKSSWRFTLPMNRDLIGLFHATQEAPFTIAVKGIK
jgi:hypothetical protein